MWSTAPWRLPAAAWGKRNIASYVFVGLSFVAMLDPLGGCQAVFLRLKRFMTSTMPWATQHRAASTDSSRAGGQAINRIFKSYIWSCIE